MTTESKPAVGRPTSRWSGEQAREERDQNKKHLLANKDEIQKRFPQHWIVIYGCHQVVGFERTSDLLSHMSQLDDFTRVCSYWVNTLGLPNSPQVSSNLLHR